MQQDEGLVHLLKRFVRRSVVLLGLQAVLYVVERLPAPVLARWLDLWGWLRGFLWPEDRRTRLGLGLTGVAMLVLTALMGPGQDTSFLESWWFKLLWYGPYTAWLVALLLSWAHGDSGTKSTKEKEQA